jgi:hypothetical protein
MKDVIPRAVQVKKASEIQAPDGPQTDGMIRMPAIVDQSDQICGTGVFLSACFDRRVLADEDSHGRETPHGVCGPSPW